MTFEEAVTEKSKLPRMVMVGGFNMIVRIVPEKDNDFHLYMIFFKRNRVTDKTAIKFSSDGQFTIHGIIRNLGETHYSTFNQIKDVGIIR